MVAIQQLQSFTTLSDTLSLSNPPHPPLEKGGLKLPRFGKGGEEGFSERSNESQSFVMCPLPGEPLDQEIIRRVVSGDADAFEVLLQRYRSLVFGIVNKHVPHDSAEEVAQDVFVRAYQSLSGYHAKSSFRRWIATIAIRSCCDFWRNRERNREVPLSTLTEEHQKWLDEVLAPQSREAFLEQATQREAREVLHYALRRLSPDDRMVLSLVHLEGLPVREAANLLGWSVIKTKVKAHRARQEMRRVIIEILP